MKKRYMTPTLVVVAVETQQVMAISGGDTVNSIIVDSTPDNSDDINRSRGLNSHWDDEE